MSRDMTRLDPVQLRPIGADQRDSDVDIRGAHVLPAAEVVGLRQGPQTLSAMWTDDGVKLDLVTHDLAKFCRLLLRLNGYVLEQVVSPLIVTTGEVHAELVALAPACLTRHHAHHYRGFATTQHRCPRRRARSPHCTTSSSVPACWGEVPVPGPPSGPDHPPPRHRPRGCLVTSL